MKRFNTYEEFLNEELDPSKFLTQEQIDWCDKHIEGKWGVNEKGEVTVPLHLKFKDRSFDRFPVQFAPVKGDFDCSYCPIASLEGAPAHVGGTFRCDYCPNLASLEGAPVRVNGNFDCSYCPDLVSLESSPSHVGGWFNCSECPNLEVLEGAPAHVGEGFSCHGCDNLLSLKGAPSHVGGGFWCHRCPKLVSLKGAPAHVSGGFDCDGCPELPSSFVEIIRDYNSKKIDWKQAHKLIHSETARKAHAIGLI